MKKNQKVTGILAAFLLLFSIASKAQGSYTFVNLLNCAVELGYEVRENSNCGGCAGNPSLIVPANGSVNIPLCVGSAGICITIHFIGGAVIPANHRYVSFGGLICHAVAPTGQAGTVAASCKPSGTFNVFLPGTFQWRIQ